MIKFIRTYKERLGKFPRLEDDRNDYVMNLFKSLKEEVKREETLEDEEVITEPPKVEKVAENKEKKKEKDLKKFKRKKNKDKRKDEKAVNRRALGKKRCYALNITEDDYDGYFDPVRPTDERRVKKSVGLNLSSNWKLALTIVALSVTAVVSFIIPFVN